MIPIIVESPQPAIVPESGMAVLTCTASGDPIPEIVWLKQQDNAGVVELLEVVGKIHIAETVSGEKKTSTLTIESTCPQDAASYSCRAQNAHGITSSESVHIFVTNTDCKLTQKLLKSLIMHVNYKD